ncbi:unnamed protein product [Cochlearia groenlandica]
MGAPKQKWTQEEETALRCGVIKHGTGKWRTILRDSEFSQVLYLRSNVDLKDKWRNMSVIASGSGSREKSRLAVRKTRALQKREDNSLAAITTSLQSDDDDLGDASALQVTTTSPSRPNVRSETSSMLDNLIMEAVETLKEPGGSDKSTIGGYIEGQYEAPLDFKRLLSSTLEYLTSRGELIKVKHKYMIPNSGNKSIFTSPSLKTDRDEVIIQTRSEIDTEMGRMKSMSVKEAAEVAAKAVAEAEAAKAEADKASKEADAAEAEAEIAQAFAEEALKTCKEVINNNT